MSDETRDTGGSAFPQPTAKYGEDGRLLHSSLTEAHKGMTLRDYFAAKAIAAMISTADEHCLFGLNGRETRCTEEAYKIADAMLATRKK